MKDKRVLSNILVYSITHALVDAACAALVFAIYYLKILDIQSFAYLVILYNLLAFAMQSPLGLLADQLRMPVPSAICGLALLAVSLLFVQWPFFAVSLAGVGNALFHIGGGIVCLNLKPKKAFLPGIFVAPGAFGLMCGALIGKGGFFIAWPFIVLLLVAATFILLIKRTEINYSTRTTGENKWFEIIILLLLISIAIRGLVGLSLVLPWKSKFELLILLTLAIVAGKACGGILGDIIGWMKISIAGLSLAAILLSFFTAYPYLAIVGAFCFNLSMPVTLTAMSNLLPGRSGFAFGLTTLALITGVLPTLTKIKILLSNQIIILSIIVISIIALYLGLKLYFNNKLKT